MKFSLLDIFRANLKYFRLKNKFSQEELSERLNKNANYIGLIENGKSIPPIPAIEQIAEVLQIDPMVLFNKDGCVNSIIKSKKEDFARQLSNNISSKMNETIYKTIMDLIKD